jgi:hypothetical protein
VRRVPARRAVVGGLGRAHQRALHLQGDARHSVLDHLQQRLGTAMGHDERAEREPSDDDLLDVEEADAVPVSAANRTS